MHYCLNISYISFYDLNEIVIGYNTSLQKVVVDGDQLVNLMRQSIDLLDSYDLLEVMQFYNKYSSFREFVREYIPEILNKIEMQDKDVIRR